MGVGGGDIQLETQHQEWLIAKRSELFFFFNQELLNLVQKEQEL